MTSIKEGKSVLEKEVVLNADATTLAEMIRNREITSLQATEIYIEHINKVNSSLNFLVENRFEIALQEAARADRLLESNLAEGKLFGVPISIKESFHVDGMKTTGGLIHRKDFVQDADAEVVRKLKEEGAIIIGKTNTPALCFCQETDNKLYGRTNNPWNLTRTAGGSSGGEAVLVAIGGAAAGLGSDIGGSIRIPSHFNGVVGFKSGNAQVSSEGSFPAEDHWLQQRMLGIGPITKTVKDAKLISNIIAKESAPTQELSDFTVHLLAETDFPLSDETKRLLDSINQFLRKHVKSKRSIPPFFNETATVWQEIMSIDGAKAHAKIAYGEKSRRPIISFFGDKVTGNSELHPYLSWALVGTFLFKPSKKRVKEIAEFVVSGDDTLNDYLQDKLFILPVYHTAAQRHGRVYKEIFSIKKTYQIYLPYIAYANVWGLPALTIPIGVDDSGMPIGIQLISKNGNEDALFQLGEKVEEAFSGYVRCL